MKHPSVRELYHYWNARRGLQAAPERSDIEPSAIRRVLADTFVLAFDARAGHPFRIAGTRVCAAFGCELRGTAFVDVWDLESQPLVRDLLGTVAHESVGVVASARGRNAQGAELDFELLALPLRHRARTDARILGALAPTELPYWFGVSRLRRLTAGSVRYLGPDWDVASGPAPRAVSSKPAPRIRHGFVVYDGGEA
jgi:hypothetical protein